MPGVGLVVYLLFGRDRRVFSRVRKLARQELARTRRPEGPGAAEDILERLERESASAYKRRLLRLGQGELELVLTVQNQLEVLQDAREAYPRLIEDIRERARARSTSSITSGRRTSSPSSCKPLLAREGARGRRGAAAVRPDRQLLGAELEVRPRDAREWRADAAVLAALPPPHDHVPQPPQDRDHRWRRRAHRGDEHRPGGARWRSGVHALA